eukprot:235062-Amphidinium_carterae.1
MLSARASAPDHLNVPEHAIVTDGCNGSSIVACKAWLSRQHGSNRTRQERVHDYVDIAMTLSMCFVYLIDLDSYHHVPSNFKPLHVLHVLSL